MGDTDSTELDEIVYGYIFPSILVIGFLGAIINMLVLFQNSPLKGFHYIYIKGMTVCDLLVVISSIPFTIKMYYQKSQWDIKMIAWYYAHLELYVVNIFCGTGVLYTVATTTERYLGFCHPFKARYLKLRHPKHPQLVIRIAPLITVLLYLPLALNETIEVEISYDNTTNVTNVEYREVENKKITDTVCYEVFNYLKEFLLRIIPAIALGLMNARIIHSYKRASHFLRKKESMRMRVTIDEVSKLKKDRRLLIVLVGITLQFIICTTPAAVLALTLDDNQDSYKYEIFRSVANLLEITKNSSSFFVYCLCSAEYRKQVTATFIKCSPKQIYVKHIFKS